MYQPVVSGTLHFEKASGTSEVLRETDTSIPHIYASSESMAMFSQGFIHAQDRLWQMERTRRVFKGRLSEILGEKTIGIDMFHRTIGIHRHSAEAVKNMDA